MKHTSIKDMNLIRAIERIDATLEELEIVQGALADLSVMVSDTVMSQEDMSDAIADSSEIVSEMFGGE